MSTNRESCNVLNCNLVPEDQFPVLEDNRYGSPTLLPNGIKVQTLCWNSRRELRAFMERRGFSSTNFSTQSCLYLETTDGRRFFLTSAFENLPFPHDGIDTELIVQVFNTVYWLDRNDPTKVLGTFQLSKPLKFYHDASVSDGVLTVRYVPMSDIIHDDPDHFEESELLTEQFALVSA
jgi:hypothetical protein